MQMHWERHLRSLADPGDASCRVSKLGTLGETLRARRWDVVSIQQASGSSPDPATYRPYAADLARLVRSEAPQARLLVHETWAYRLDSPRFPAISPDHATMYRELAAAYAGIAAELDLPLVPVGSAFFAADTDPTWGLRITDPAWNPKTAVYPSVPDNGRSLHKGWHWVKSKDGTHAVGYDGGHAGVNGCYLASCVWFEVLFQASVVGNPYRPEQIPADYARFLQETAHAAVAARKRPGPAR